MNPSRRSILFAIRIVSDQCVVALAWIIAFYVRFCWFPVEKGIPSTGLYFKLVPFIVVIWTGVFFLTGFYRRSRRERSAFLEALDIWQASILATLCFLAFSYFYEEYRYSRLSVLIFFVLHPWLIIISRSLIRKCLRIYRRGRPLKNIAVLASKDLLDRLLEVIRASEDAPYNVVLTIVTDADGLPKDWLAQFQRFEVAGVYVALSYVDAHRLRHELRSISEQVLDVRLLPDVQEFVRFGAGVAIVSGLPLIRLHENPLQGFALVQKRLLDIVGSALGLLLLSPVFFVLSLLVKLSSPGPIFYRQQRMGLDGKVFDCLKFRSMPIDVEKSSGPVFAKAGEDRATSIGKVLRRTSLDELPQLINVLKGEMSLVGPRPERPVFVSEFRQKIPGYMLRHTAKAGITGWAQVNGWRGDTSIEKRIEFDLYYIQNWTLWLDIWILMLTVVEVIRGKNAY